MIDDRTGTAQLNDSSPDDDLPGCRPPLWLVGVALGVLVLACYGGIQLFSVVYGLVLPPSAPRPDDVVEITHDDISDGVDEWRYQTALTPCELVTFYEEKDGICTFDEGNCDGGVYQRPYYSEAPFATCSATQPFSIFALRWRVQIDPQYVNEPGASTFTLFSEILWGGAPNATETPPPSSTPRSTAAPETTDEPGMTTAAP